VGTITRNEWLSGIALGLASLSILPESAIAQARKAELQQARDALWKAWFFNDRVTLEKMLSKDVIAINNGQREWEHRAQILESAKQFAARGGRLVRLSFPHVETQFFGDVAIIYSDWTTETEIQGKRVVSSGRATEVFIDRDGRWLNAGRHLHSVQ
jgi:ketosteroid isomerase-like protein